MQQLQTSEMAVLYQVLNKQVPVAVPVPVVQVPVQVPVPNFQVPVPVPSTTRLAQFLANPVHSRLKCIPGEREEL